MNYLKRAFTSIKRKPSKSLLLFILVFTLGNIIIGAIAVERAVNNTEANLRNRMRPLLSFDPEQRLGANGVVYSPEPLTAEMIRNITNLPQVSQHHYSFTVWLETTQLLDYFPGQRIESNFPGQFTLRGGSSEIPLQFNEGVLELVTGDYFSTESFSDTSGIKPIIISQEVATLNNLSVGSIINFELNVLKIQPSRLGIGTWDENWHLNPENIYASELFQLKVIGVFDIVEREGHDLTLSRERQNFLNIIFTTAHATETINYFQSTNYWRAWEEGLAEIGTTFYDFFGRDLPADSETAFLGVVELYDASQIEDFKIATNQFLPDGWLITDLSNSFAAITSSMDTLQEIGRWTLLISVGATILILSLLITLYLHDRRNEIGVYAALGEKKIKIVSQILIEITVVTIIGMSLAVFTGSLLSENMSRFMIQNQLRAEQSGTNFNFSNSMLDRLGFSQEMSVDSMLESFEMSLNLETVGLFFGTGIIVVALSTMIPVIYVVSLNPKKILLKS